MEFGVLDVVLLVTWVGAFVWRGIPLPWRMRSGARLLLGVALYLCPSVLVLPVAVFLVLLRPIAMPPIAYFSLLRDIRFLVFFAFVYLYLLYVFLEERTVFLLLGYAVLPVISIIITLRAEVVRAFVISRCAWHLPAHQP